MGVLIKNIPNIIVRFWFVVSILSNIVWRKEANSVRKWNKKRDAIDIASLSMGGRWGIRTPDPLLVRQMLWTSWAKRPSFVLFSLYLSKAMQRYGFFPTLQTFCPKSFWKSRFFKRTSIETKNRFSNWRSIVDIGYYERFRFMTEWTEQRRSVTPWYVA